MTLAQLEEILPNGFHDAELLGVDLDERSGLAILRMRLLTSRPPEGLDEELIEYRLAALSLSGLLIFTAPEQLLQSSWSKLDVQGFVPSEQQWPQIASLDEESKHLAYSFFVHDWNASIHTVASQATLSWLKDK